MLYLTALGFFLFFLGVLIYFIHQEATKSARLNALKREIKERERANRVIDTVRTMPIDRVRDKLKDTK